MKLQNIIIPVAASAMLLTGCDDQKMEWGTPEGHYPVTIADIPLEVKEVLANYDNLKAYAAEHHPNMVLGLGVGADIYLGTDGRGTLANDNFQMITLGNAMKHDAIVGKSGAFSFTTVDNVIDALPEGMQLYGHNFIWYQQQQQSYLKSLINPTLVTESNSDIKTMLAGDAADFEGGTTGGWGSWGSNKDNVTVEDGAGVDGTKGAVLKNKGDGNMWEAQFAYTFDTPLEKDVEYTIRFKARCDNGAGELQFQYQNSSTYGSQGGYASFDIGTEWVTCEKSFTITEYDDVDRIIINFGKVAGIYYLDEIEFGIMEADPMDNVLAGDASDFEGGSTGGWGSWGSNKESAEVVEGQGYNDSYGLVLANKGDGNMWEAQNAYTFDVPLQQNKKYIIQFYAKSDTGAGELQFQYQNSTTYGSQGGYATFSVGTDWILCEKEFTITDFDDVDRIIINFGKVAGTYYIDNIKFGLAKDQSSAEESAAKITKFVKTKSPRKANSYYVFQTPDEKRAVLLEAMESWIKGMSEHLEQKGCVPAGYDVINEPITDGNGQRVRGVDNVFGGSDTDDDGNTTYDSAPVEDPAKGLNLNWGGNRFYWGYYVKDYAVKAFQYARQYLPAETKLFVNDYNLETSPNKLASLIQFVQGIDQANGSPIVDGIGTQMHVSIRPTDDAAENAEIIAALKEQVDAMFQTLAATGKLVRVTELDISLGTSSPSSNQYKAQSDAYKMIFESFFANVPEAQQSGITIWSLTDADDEHEYWLKGEKPNLFDANFLRKWAYKGVSDALAGEDLGLKYGGTDYKAFYEKQNVSETVK